MLHGNIHRHLLTLSLINWGIACVCWIISAWLGTSSPASIFVYTILFVVGLFAAIVAVLSFVLADFGHEPGVAAAETAAPPAGDASGPVSDTGA
ncbi:MAG TPA: hypothetical protein VFD50_09085 [Thermoleophilia bacterium]|nr:hypothetical protein [Thermoleophilia bacterium]